MTTPILKLFTNMSGFSQANERMSTVTQHALPTWTLHAEAVFNSARSDRIPAVIDVNGFHTVVNGSKFEVKDGA